MTDLAKRVVIAVILFFLVAFAYVGWMRAQEFRDRNNQLTETNNAIKDTAQLWIDSLATVDTALSHALQRGDSLAARTGEIRWHTRTVRLDGRIDTVEVATVRVDTAYIEIPVQVAEELLACRALTETCDEYRETADSTIKWQATSIDSLDAQIKHLSERFSVPQLRMLGLSLPLPGINIGYGVMYGLGGCSDETTQVTGDFEINVETSCNNIHHGPVLSLSWPIKLW